MPSSTLLFPLVFFTFLENCFSSFQKSYTGLMQLKHLQKFTSECLFPASHKDHQCPSLVAIGPDFSSLSICECSLLLVPTQMRSHFSHCLVTFFLSPHYFLATFYDFYTYHDNDS